MTAAVLTTSYAPDFARFERLHSSVLENSELPHFVFVPQSDRDLFSPLTASGRLTVVTTRDVLGAHFRTTEGINRAASRIPGAPSGLRWAAINVRRPWPPVRGWILQQVIKLAAAERVDADTLIYMDSEIEIIRPITESTFRHGEVTRLYRKPGGISVGMTRHRNWHTVARRLINAESGDLPPFDDYIGGITTWDRGVVAALTARIGEVSRIDWQSAVARELDVSENILYGEYIAEFGTSAQLSFSSDRSLCHSYWDTAQLDRESATRFVDAIGDEDVAVHIQSNSNTRPEIERFIRAAVRSRSE